MSRVLDALDRLPAQERQVVVLHELAGLSVPELAARLARPPAQVQAQLAHGRHVLAALLVREDVRGCEED